MLTMTENAQKAVQRFKTQDQNLKDKALRIFVEPGGCSGFQYGFTFSDKKDGDEIVSFEGFDLVVDPMSIPYLRGIQVDYVDGLQGSGFAIRNPNASGSCGCGHSFST